MDFHSEISFDSFNMKILDRWSSSFAIIEDSSNSSAERCAAIFGAKDPPGNARVA